MKKFTGKRGQIVEIIERTPAYKRGELEVIHEGRTVIVIPREFKHFNARRVTSELQRKGYYCTLISKDFGEGRKMVLSVKTNMQRRDDTLS